VYYRSHLFLPVYPSNGKQPHQYKGDANMQPEDRIDKFNESAKRALSLAQDEALRMQHNYIGTEHLLLGLLREEEGIAAKVLQGLGVETSKVRQAVEFIIGRGDKIVMSEIGLTPRSKKVIELGIDEARRLGHHYIGTEHLLLGLAREGEGIAVGVLQSLGVSPDNVRLATLKALGAPVPETLIEHSPESQVEGASQRAEPVAQTTGSSRFDKFTERARRVFAFAQEEARRFQHNFIGTEHLLLGLIRDGDGVALQVMRNLGIDPAQVREKVEYIIGRGDRIVQGQIGLTPRAKKVVELAVDEARRMNHHYIGTEHLLLGLVREGEGIAAGVLESLGMNLEKTRREIRKVLEAG
jgi:ATP-dependent Clp protease ATP-binding subunit ClpA